MYAPTLIPSQQRIELVGSQIDLAPTILGLLNMDYNSEFFGRDLLAVPQDRSWAVMSHNRDISLYRHDTLAVLGMGKTVELWRAGTQPGSMIRIDQVADSGIILDAVAYYQTAFELYENHRLHPLQQDLLAGRHSHTDLTN